MRGSVQNCCVPGCKLSKTSINGQTAIYYGLIPYRGIFIAMNIMMSTDANNVAKKNLNVVSHFEAPNNSIIKYYITFIDMHELHFYLFTEDHIKVQSMKTSQKNRNTIIDSEYLEFISNKCPSGVIVDDFAIERLERKKKQNLLHMFYHLALGCHVMIYIRLVLNETFIRTLSNFCTVVEVQNICL